MAYGSSPTNQPQETRPPHPEYTRKLNEVRAAIRRAREYLTPWQRLVFLLRYELDPQWTQREIAAATDRSKTTIHDTEHKALRVIRGAISDQEGVKGEKGNA